MTTETMTTDTTGQVMPSAMGGAAVPTVGASSRPRVLVLGGGVAGLTAAYEMRRRLGDRARVTVVSEHDHFLLGPALLWVPFGRTTGTISFSIAVGLERHGISFVQARVDQIDPEDRVVHTSYQGRDTDLPYDYLLITTGPRADSTAIPGVSGQFNATASIWSETTAVEARHALERFLDQPGPVVVGAAQGAQYLSAAYEFALSLDHELRRRGKRGQATITFITPEPYLGHLDIGAPAARRALERLFARRQITAITGAAIARVDREGVVLRDGSVLPASYTMIIPPFSGVLGVWKSAGLTDEHGFVPVDARYRHARYPEIYAAGVGAHVAASSPAAVGLPKTGYLSAAMAKVAAHNVAAAITGDRPAARTLPRVLDLRLLDGGDGGVLLVTADLLRPLHLALPLPGHTAHWAKEVLTRYLLWKLRTGRSSWL